MPGLWPRFAGNEPNLPRRSLSELLSKAPQEVSLHQCELLCPGRRIAVHDQLAATLAQRGGVGGELPADGLFPCCLDRCQRRLRSCLPYCGPQRLRCRSRRPPPHPATPESELPGELPRRMAAWRATAGTAPSSAAVSRLCPRPSSRETSSSRCSGSSSLITSSSSISGGGAAAASSASRSANSSASSAAR